MSQRIQVFVRKRPCLQREANKPQIVEVIEEQSQVRLLDPDVFGNTSNVNSMSYININNKEITSSTVSGKTQQARSNHKETLFTFDGVFDEEVPTERIYTQVGQGHIDDVINGFNTTFFAYGATGAGKTYTMLGSSESTSSSSSTYSLSQSISQQPFQSRGMMSLMVSGLFESIKFKQATHDVTVRLAYMEIYNEAIKDLLSLNTKGLQIREHTKSDTTIIHGLTEIEVNNDSQVSAILKVGSRNRSKDSTALNDSSSRSHAILQLTVECLERRSSNNNATEQHHQQNQQLVTSKLMMVDLAGSEKSWTNKSKASKLEGANINQSLLALGNCIQLLSQIHMNQTAFKDTFIPYRASKLTRILKDSLGGNCRTIMIANISGSILSYDDTYNTLKYASRAKNITVHVQQNITTHLTPQTDYSVIIENLSRENENLRSMLQSNNNSSFDAFNDNATAQTHKRIQTSSGNNNHISQVNSSRNDTTTDEDKKLTAEIENNMNKHFEEEAMCVRIIAEANQKIERIKKSNIQLEIHSKIQTNNNNTNANNVLLPSSSSQQQSQGYLAYTNQQSLEEAKSTLEESQSKLKQLVHLRKSLLPFQIINGQPSNNNKNNPSSLGSQLSLKSQQYLSNAFNMHELKSNNLQLSSKISRESDDIDQLERELNALSHQVELRESILNQQKQTNSNSSKDLFNPTGKPTKPASMATFQSIITSLPSINNSSVSQNQLPSQDHQQFSNQQPIQEQQQQQSGYLSINTNNNLIPPKQQRLVQQSSAWKNYYSPSYGSYLNNNNSLSQNSLPSSNSISPTKQQFHLKTPNFSKYTPTSISRSRYVKYSPTQHFSSIKHSSHSRHASSSSLLQLNNEEPSIVSSYLSYQYTGPDDNNNKKKNKYKRKEYYQPPQIVESRIFDNNNRNTNINNNHSSLQQGFNDNHSQIQRLRNQSSIQYDNYSFEPTEKRKNITGITSNREGGGGNDNTVTIPIKKLSAPTVNNNNHTSSLSLSSPSKMLTNWINNSNPSSTPSTNRILPQIIISRNSRSTYDVHQSPYVRSFNSPSLSSRKNKQSLQLISPNTRQAQLQKLNRNINQFKQQYDGNNAAKQQNINYGVVA